MNCESCTHKRICKFEEYYKAKQKELDMETFLRLSCDHYKNNKPVYNFREFGITDAKPISIETWKPKESPYGGFEITC